MENSSDVGVAVTFTLVLRSDTQRRQRQHVTARARHKGQTARESERRSNSHGWCNAAHAHVLVRTVVRAGVAVHRPRLHVRVALAATAIVLHIGLVVGRAGPRAACDHTSTCHTTDQGSRSGANGTCYALLSVEQERDGRNVRARDVRHACERSSVCCVVQWCSRRAACT
jgi:hypothetical protein